MNILIGLEKEFFIKKYSGIPNTDDETYYEEFISATDADISDTCDECGYLAEIRGEPKDNIISAIFSLREKEFRLKRKIKENIILSDSPYANIPKKLMFKFRRTYGKGAAHDECMYKDIKEKSFQTAGLHIHFSNRYERTLHCNCGLTSTYQYSEQLNVPRIIKALDKFFIKQIKEAKRQIGIYEMKPWGFEYRSLPNDINEELLISFFKEFEF